MKACETCLYKGTPKKEKPCRTCCNALFGIPFAPWNWEAASKQANPTGTEEKKKRRKENAENIRLGQKNNR